MRAIVYRDFGSPDVLHMEDIEKPAPRAGEVLIRVRAAGTNPLDWHLMGGGPLLLRMLMGLHRLKRPGVDVAGEVEAVGTGVSRFKAGDAVFGLCKGAFAEYVCAKEKTLTRKPPLLSFEEAAATPVAGLTALQALRDKARVLPEHRVLVNGASGGVGTFAVQIARALGAEVTGVCSTANLQMVEALGAAHVIDYTREDFTAATERYDVIFDLVGNHSLAEFRRVLSPHGTYIACGGGAPGSSIGKLLGSALEVLTEGLFSRRQRLVLFLARFSGTDLETLRALMEEGKVRPVIDRTLVLDEAAEAIRYLESMHAHGKVVLRVETPGVR